MFYLLPRELAKTTTQKAYNNTRIDKEEPVFFFYSERLSVLNEKVDFFRLYE